MKNEKSILVYSKIKLGRISKLKEKNPGLIIGVVSCLVQQVNRVCKVEEYMKKVNHLRKLNSQIGIASDIIVGFPGETQNDYQ